MKKFYFALMGILCLSILSCKKDKSSPGQKDETAVELMSGNEYNPELPEILAANADFREFTKNFIVHVTTYSKQYLPVKDDPSYFLTEIEHSNLEDSSLRRIYTDYSMDMDDMIIEKNHIDNDVYTLINNYPDLKDYDDSTATQMIFDAIDIGFASSDTAWDNVKAYIDNELAHIQFRTSTSGLTWDEAWGCIKQAVGITAGSLILLNSLSTLTVTSVVTTVSKFILKNAGWWSAAIMIIDASACMYSEYND